MTKAELISLWTSDPIEAVTAYRGRAGIPVQTMLDEAHVVPRTYQAIRSKQTATPTYATVQALVLWMLEKERVI